MNTHVFVVDYNTFKYHLEYLFAGTGANKEISLDGRKLKVGVESPFLTNPSISNNKNASENINPTVERMLVGMISDISRIRINDRVVFYLQAHNKKAGKFYGTFRVSSNPFFDENNSKNYLKDKLGIGLSFRVKIKPDAVYPKGVTEHDFLDSLEGITNPYDLCWSLIYRKLKGNRGCTMITEFEYKRLVSKLEMINTNVIDGNSFSFDTKKDEIIALNNKNEYAPDSLNNDMLDINILPRLLFQANSSKSFETHLQAYLTKYFDKGCLKTLLLKYGCDAWIGNEVACGVGMQRIDLLLIQESDDNVFIRLVELKDESPTKEIVTSQIPWYLEWLSYYYIPKYTEINKTIEIVPTIIAKGSLDDKLRKIYQNFSYNINGTTVKSLEYIGFSISTSDLLFEKYL